MVELAGGDVRSFSATANRTSLSSPTLLDSSSYLHPILLASICLVVQRIVMPKTIGTASVWRDDAAGPRRNTFLLATCSNDDLKDSRPH